MRPIQDSNRPFSEQLQSLLTREAGQPKLQTDIPLLDSFLLGGISPNCITEIVGSPGIGKTQLCHMLAANALRKLEDDGLGNENSTVLYVDCENAFSRTRIEELMNTANAQRPDNPPFASVKDAQQRIRMIPLRSSVDFTHLLSSLESTILSLGASLVIVDSIAALVRHEFDSSSMIKRQNLLTGWAGLLKSISEKTQIPVIVTNQVTASGSSEGSSIAALGTGWYHCVNTRLYLHRFNSSDFGISTNTVPALIMKSTPEGCRVTQETTLRIMSISKSPISPVVSFPYFITSAGLCLVKRLELSETLPSDPSDEEQPYYLEFEPSNYWFT